MKAKFNLTPKPAVAGAICFHYNKNIAASFYETPARPFFENSSALKQNCSQSVELSLGLRYHRRTFFVQTIYGCSLPKSIQNLRGHCYSWRVPVKNVVPRFSPMAVGLHLSQSRIKSEYCQHVYERALMSVFRRKTLKAYICCASLANLTTYDQNANYGDYEVIPSCHGWTNRSRETLKTQAWEIMHEMKIRFALLHERYRGRFK